ncbi:MAG: VCBS repeat-containing protein [Thermoguttaceae bacterium]|nr:VCBS repeat-containing protein [Thermoguttaceae bacterium]MDW8078396.1 VCBS repeat-containing protein [Thermoguttaceae bacterium]
MNTRRPFPTPKDRARRATAVSLVIISAMAVLGGVPPLEPKGACSAEMPERVSFHMHRIGSYRGEPCGVGDFNRDGRLDVVAGPYIYFGPNWRRFQFREVKGDVDGKGIGYRYDFMNLPLDVDHDGWLDVVSCSWHEKWSLWFRNPAGEEKPWESFIIEEGWNFECGELVDVDGDGRAEEILPQVLRTVWYERLPAGSERAGFRIHVVSEKHLPFGGGVGDVNGDGRPDIIRPAAWFEAPKDIRSEPWREHPLTLGDLNPNQAAHTAQILVFDVDGDGFNDLIASSAHSYGLFCYRQKRSGDQITWEREVIDQSWSQVHSLALGDLDGDGVPELVTGKRFMAHNGSDPGEFEPLGVYYYKILRNKGEANQPQVKWWRVVITFDQGIGSGMNIPIVDLDGDGDNDIVVTGKWGGPVWFENLRQ